MTLANEAWQVNPRLNIGLVGTGAWWNIKSVLFEELIFREVILYILISAAAFGIYHWFSFGILGNPVQMIVVFFITATAGLLYAYGYAKTFSLSAPAAIHFGWNFTRNFVFSDGLIGNGIFILVRPAPFRTDSWFVFFTVSLLPMAGMLLIIFLLLRNRQQVSTVKRGDQR